MRCKSSQVATEMIIIFAGALIVLSILLVVNTDIMGSVNTRLRHTKAKVAVNDIGDAAELVYQQGIGSRTKVYIALPSSIDTARVSGKTISINFRGEQEVIYRNLGFNVTGNLPVKESFYWICVESMEGYVSVSECTVCGNSIKESGEECDDGNQNNNDACKNDCANNICGDGYIYTGFEVCDDPDLSPYSSDCGTYPGFDGGILSCYADCSGYDTSLCTVADTIPPAAVTNLANQSQGSTWIYWSWTNPIDEDFSKAIIHIDGINLENTSNNYYNATGLSSNTSYTIIIHTKDTSGNVNDTDVSNTAKTLEEEVVEPMTISSILYVQECAAEDNAEKGSFGGACYGTYPASCGAGNDLLTCDDGEIETHTAKRVGGIKYYGGIKISSYNSSVTKCDIINSVELCYEWWVNALIQDCDVSVDANAGNSFTAVTTTCPGYSSNPGAICENVTTLESWTCQSFFGTVGTRAYAKSEAQRSGGSGTTIISWDVLYFNVTYTTG